MRGGSATAGKIYQTRIKAIENDVALLKSAVGAAALEKAAAKAQLDAAKEVLDEKEKELAKAKSILEARKTFTTAFSAENGPQGMAVVDAQANVGAATAAVEKAEEAFKKFETAGGGGIKG